MNAAARLWHSASGGTPGRSWARCRWYNRHAANREEPRKAEFFDKAASYQLFFNSERKSRWQDNKTALDLLRLRSAESETPNPGSAIALPGNLGVLAREVARGRPLAKPRSQIAQGAGRNRKSDTRTGLPALRPIALPDLIDGACHVPA